MNQSLVGGANFDRPHPTRAIYRDRQNEIPVRVAATSGNSVWFHRRYDQVWRSKLPAFHEMRPRRNVAGISFDCTLRNPLLNESNLSIRQTALLLELQVPGFGQPGRHEVRVRHRDDLVGVFLNVLVVQKRKRPRFPGTVAARAVLVNDGRDVATESYMAASG